MNKIYLSALALLAGATISAQVIINPSFENWTAGEPDDWTLELPADGTLDVATPITEANALTPIPDGNSYIRLESFSVTGSTDTDFPDGIYGAAASQVFASAIKYSEFSFDTQYSLVGSDMAVVAVLAVDATGQAAVGQGYIELDGASTAWENHSISMTYTGVPAFYIVTLASSEEAVFGTQGVAAEKASWLAVDNFVVGPALQDAPSVTNVIASDISNNQNGSDLQITFDIPDETNVDKYYVAVFASAYSGNNLANPEAFFVANGIEITPNGANQTHTFSSSDVYYDVVGGFFEDNPIVEDVEFVVSVYTKGATGFVGAIANSNPITLTSIVSVTEYSKEVSVYPNPANNFVNFTVDGLENGTVVINSITGQEVVNTTIANGTKKVNLSKLNNGVYIYTIRNQNGEIVKTNKLVVRK